MVKISCFFALLAFALASDAAESAPTLRADTNKPEMSLFSQGEEVELAFTASNLAKDEAGLSLHVSIADVQGAIIEEKSLPVKPNADGVWSAKMKAPSTKLGFYRVWAKLSNGVTLPEINSKPAGYLGYGITFDPAGRKLYPQADTFFGLQGGFGKGINAQAYLGVRWILGPTQWRNAEPDYPGQFAARVDALKKKGGSFDPRPAIYFPSKGKLEKWAMYFQFGCVGANEYYPIKWKNPPCAPRGKDELSSGPSCILTPEGEKHFENYCRTLAKAAALADTGMTEHYYEVLWEPNIFFGGRPEDLVRQLKIAYAAIHAEDPKAIVMGPTLSTLSPFGGCLGGSSLEYTKKLLAKGLGDYIDAYSIHPYTGAPPERFKLAECYRELKKILREACGRDVPIVGTEQGYASSGKPDDELLYAQCVVRQNLMALGEGLRYNLAFYTAMAAAKDRAPGVSSGFGFFHCLDAPSPYNERVTPMKVCPRPQALAYAAMTYLLEGHKGAGSIDWLGESARGYVYENTEEATLALWDFGDTPRQISIPVGVETAEVHDWMGNKSLLPTDNGSLRLELGNSPVYVKNVSRKLWGSGAAKFLRVAQSNLQLFPGENCKLPCFVAASAEKPFDGTLRINSSERVKASPIEQGILLAAGSSKECSFDIAVSPDTPAGRYPVSFMLTAKGYFEGAACCVVEVKEPLRLGRLRPSSDDKGRKVATFLMSELRGCSVKGSLQAGIQGNVKRLDFALAPKEEREIAVAFEGLELNPAKKCEVSSEVKTDSGYALKRVEKTNFLSAKRLSQRPSIDGDVAKWSAIPSLNLNSVDFCERRPDLYSGDSAKIRYAWDDNALYLFAEVKDNVFMQEQTINSQLWLDDSLQCGFTTEPWKESIFSANLLAEEENKPMRSEIVLALAKGGPIAWRAFHEPRNEKLHPGPLPPNDCQFIARKEGETIIYEAAFSWKALGLEIAPAPGEYIAVTVAVNDRDSKQQAEPSALCLFNGATLKKDPVLMGLLLFEK